MKLHWIGWRENWDLFMDLIWITVITFNQRLPLKHPKNELFNGFEEFLQETSVFSCKSNMFFCCKWFIVEWVERETLWVVTTDELGLHQHKNEDSVDRVAGTTQFTSSQGSKHPNEGETASSVFLGMQETSEKKEYEKGKHLRKNIKTHERCAFCSEMYSWSFSIWSNVPTYSMLSKIITCWNIMIVNMIYEDEQLQKNKIIPSQWVNNPHCQLLLNAAQK